MIDLKQALSYMVDNHYLVVINSDIVITRRLKEALGFSAPQTVVTAIEQVKVPADIVKTAVKPITKKKKMTDADLREMWHQFVADADIPWKVTTNTGQSYTVRQYGPTPAAHLYEVIASSDVDYEVLTAATKAYYKNTSYKAILSNYIIKDIWKDAYNDYLLNNGKVDMSGGNRFED